MNERIEKLAKQAGLKWKAQPPHYTNSKSPIDFPVSANRDLENFAELIVRECIREIGYKSVELLDIDFYPHYQERLKKYFGVEP